MSNLIGFRGVPAGSVLELSLDGDSDSFNARVTFYDADGKVSDSDFAANEPIRFELGLEGQAYLWGIAVAFLSSKVTVRVRIVKPNGTTHSQPKELELSGKAGSVAAATVLARTRSGAESARQAKERAVLHYEDRDSEGLRELIRLIREESPTLLQRRLLKRLMRGGMVEYFDTDELPEEPSEQATSVEKKVFFATDRKMTGEHRPSSIFSGKRGEKTRYGVATISIPDSHRIGELERPGWLRREDRSRHLTLLRIELKSNSKFVVEARKEIKRAEEAEALVFLHGYNVAFDAALYRTAQLAYDLKFRGLPILYSWPSEGKTRKYPVDEGNVEWATPHFRDFLKLVLEKLGASTVHVIAHSMGNRALVQALNTYDPSGLAPDSAQLRQVILAAPDIDADVFRHLAHSFAGKASRVTLYSSAKDRAIELAMKYKGGYSRAGGAITIVSGVDTLDATAVSTDFLAHSYYGASILADIFALIWHGHPPDLRHGTERRTLDGQPYWQMRAGAF